MTAIAPVRQAEALKDIAAIFRYPQSDYRQQLQNWLAAYADEFPDAAKYMQQFNAAILKHQDTELEEIYTRTFDMAPMCSPYISGHIYGDENFERGTLLTALNERYVAANFDTRQELPDHLALILEFTPNFSAEEMSELAEYCLTKPLAEMRSALGDNPYGLAIDAARNILSTVEILHEGASQ